MSAAHPPAPAPRVSVIVPFLDGEEFLAEAIDSVLAQTFTVLELLLVDDGSGPAATGIARRYARQHPERVRYLDHEGHVNRGLSATRNAGLAAARGELIALLDADDVWRDPAKLASQVAILDAHPELGLVCGAVRYWRSWSNPAAGDVIVPTGHVADRVVAPPEASLALYPLGSAAAPCPSDLVFRRQLALDVGGFEAHFTGQLQLYEDQAFLAKVYLRAAVWFASDVWLDYRQHERSLMAQWSSRYAEVRGYFLRWFADHLAEHRAAAGPSGTGLTPDQHRAVVRAVSRARRRNRHRLLRRTFRRPARVPARLRTAVRRS